MNSLFVLIPALFIVASAFPNGNNNRQSRDSTEDYYVSYGNMPSFDTTQFDTAKQQLKTDNQQTIDDYKAGKLNDEQFKTHMYINQYEYDQTVSALFTNTISNVLRGPSTSAPSTTTI